MATVTCQVKVGSGQKEQQTPRGIDLGIIGCEKPILYLKRALP